MEKGQPIARIGNADGFYGNNYHLHFEIRAGDSTDHGPGYTPDRSTPQGQIDPNEFIKTHRR